MEVNDNVRTWAVITFRVANVNPKLFAKFRKSIPPAWRAVVQDSYVRFRCSSNTTADLTWMSPEHTSTIYSMLVLMKKR